MSCANWYALYVKSRHEFRVNSDLQRKGIITFLPSVTRRRQWQDRKKDVEFPLFPGYLFVHLVPGEFGKAIRAPGTVTFVSMTPGCPTPVSPEEINSLKIMIQSREKIDVYPHLKEGAPVRVRRGVLQGAEGILEKKEDQHFLIVVLTLLGRSVGVKIHADDVEAA